jgi:hypothetical protein
MTKEEKEKPQTFAEMWELNKKFGDNAFKDIAQTFYTEGKKLGWPDDFIYTLVGFCTKLDNLDDYYTEVFATKDDDIKPLQKKLAAHKHLRSGEAVEPL